MSSDWVLGNSFASDFVEFRASFAHRRLKDDAEKVKEFSQQILQLRKSSAFLLIPAHVDDLDVVKLLDQYSASIIRHDITIIILVNGTAKDCSQALFDLKLEAIIKDVASLEVLSASSISVLSDFTEKFVGMGRIRGLVCDAVCFAAHTREIADPLVIWADADQFGMHPDRIGNLLSSFSGNEDIGLLAGEVIYDHSVRNTRTDEAPLLPELRLFDLINSALNQAARNGVFDHPHVWNEGANMAFRLSAYCAAGGFEYQLCSGEDDQIGHAIQSLSERRVCVSCFHEHAWVSTNPRRILRAIISGRTGMEAWGWQSFDELQGHTMLLDELCAQYRNSSYLLQKNDILLNKKKTETRISWTFFRSLLFDSRVKNALQLNQVADLCGISLSHCKYDRELNEFEASIDWKRSSILDRLDQ